MTEPYASEFRRLIRLGAGARDIHAPCTREVAFARRTAASDEFVARELSRVETHRRGCCALLEAFAGRVSRVLDVGCSTGGTTVALALSKTLEPDVVLGVDPDSLSLRAAEVRARGHGLDPRRVAFVRNEPGQPLPFANDTFDLVVCVSVLEFLPTAAARRRLVADIRRVTRPGGLVFLSTPNPLRLRDAHAHRWLGDFVRREGCPWASLPWSMRAMVSGFERVPIEGWVMDHALRRVGVPARLVPRALAPIVAWTGGWQKLLVRKPLGGAATAHAAGGGAPPAMSA